MNQACLPLLETTKHGVLWDMGETRPATQTAATAERWGAEGRAITSRAKTQASTITRQPENQERVPATLGMLPTHIGDPRTKGTIPQLLILPPVNNWRMLSSHPLSKKTACEMVQPLLLTGAHGGLGAPHIHTVRPPPGLRVPAVCINTQLSKESVRVFPSPL